MNVGQSSFTFDDFVHQNLLCIQYVNEQMPKVGMYRKVIRKKKMKKKISGLIFLKSPLDPTVNGDDYFFFLVLY